MFQEFYQSSAWKVFYVGIGLFILASCELPLKKVQAWEEELNTNPGNVEVIRSLSKISQDGSEMQRYEALRVLKLAALKNDAAKEPVLAAAADGLKSESHLVKMQSSLVFREIKSDNQETLDQVLDAMEDPELESDVFKFLCDALLLYEDKLCSIADRLTNIWTAREVWPHDPSVDPRLRLLSVVQAAYVSCPTAFAAMLNKAGTCDNDFIRQNANDILNGVDPAEVTGDQ